MRGMTAKVAEVSKALQSVRALIKTRHIVVFGDGMVLSITLSIATPENTTRSVAMGSISS